MNKLKPSAYRPLIKAALKEDFGNRGDVTSQLFIPKSSRFHGRIICREPGVICGLDLAAAIFKACAPSARLIILARDGDRVRPGQAVMTLFGDRGLLSAERTALNFLQRMSGVATLTRKFVDAIKGTNARILDTRKTLPGWRALDKYAVACGGGVNHRMGLYDAVMVKDNHRFADLAAGVDLMRRKFPTLPLIIECDTPAQIPSALALRPSVVLLDNMPPATLRLQIARIRRLAPKVAIEVSGRVNLATVRRIAQLGPDRISIGKLTHSAPAMDIGLDLG